MLYGWIEVGASNVGVFSSQHNNDIILRTASSNNKILIGNQMYDIMSGSNTSAALYISNNNVGIDKVPAFNVQLDINGTMNINNSITFTESMVGKSNKPTTFVNSNSDFYIFHNGSQKIQLTDQQGINIADKVVSTADFFASAYNVISDSNLKREIQQSDYCSDAQTLEEIKIYDYRYYSSSSTSKGFIAQQVEEIFPQAIQKTMGYIPSSTKTIFLSHDGVIPVGTLPFEVQEGERIVAKSSGRPCEFIVYKISDNSIYVSGDRQYMGFNVEVTGKNGFIRTIDTNQMLALSFATIKHLQLKVSNIEAKMEELLHSLNFATSQTTV